MPVAPARRCPGPSTSRMETCVAHCVCCCVCVLCWNAMLVDVWGAQTRAKSMAVPVLVEPSASSSFSSSASTSASTSPTAIPCRLPVQVSAFVSTQDLTDAVSRSKKDTLASGGEDSAVAVAAPAAAKDAAAVDGVSSSGKP